MPADVGDHDVMTGARLTATTERDLAIRRLRRVTTGTLAGAVAAVGGIAYVAATTLPGHSAAAASSPAAGLSGSDDAAPGGGDDSSTIPPMSDPGLQPPGQLPGYGGPGGFSAQSGGS